MPKMSSRFPRWLQRDGSKSTFVVTNRYFYISALVIIVLILILQPLRSAGWHLPDMSSITPNADSDTHIIHDLVAKADEQFEALRRAETFSIRDAAKQYRERRGRHPPPGFDDWYTLARQSSTVIVESFFDQIYNDLEPFWGIDPQELREFTQQWPRVLSFRNGKSARPFPWEPAITWYGTWENMTRTMPNLPDVDLALLAEDYPIVMASFDKVSKAMSSAASRYKEHRAIPVEQIKQKIAPRPSLTGPMPTSWPTQGLVPYLEDEPEVFWDYVVAACKDTDPAVKHPELVPKASLPLVYSEKYTAGTTKGFISNITQAKSVCHNPNLRTLHGNVIRPGQPKFYNELHPVFMFGKIAGIHNDIVIPAPANFRDGMYAGLKSMQPWEKKKDTLIWRGSATGGDWRPDGWYGFHRHRFISVLNATLFRQAQIDMAGLAAEGLPQTYSALQKDYASRNETFDIEAHRIALPPASLFKHSLTGFADWLEAKIDVAFTHYFCWPFRGLGAPGICPSMESVFKLAGFSNSSEVLMHKYLPDIDGQSISARFRGFLQSTSVPIKATIFTEWHDSRLTPWRDYIPLSNEFQEIYELLYFFIGDSSKQTPQTKSKRSWWRPSKNARKQADPDAIGERIGQQGSEWTRRVMRNEDMVLYFHRLILEYARITSDDRVELGWVDDLRASGNTDSIFNDPS